MKSSHYYSVDEFNGNQNDMYMQDTNSLVEKKVNMLYDFCILRRRKGRWGKELSDSREDAVREMLAACGTERAMTIRLHDVLKGDCSLDSILKPNKYV